jgi:cellulose synthase operon protein C
MGTEEDDGAAGDEGANEASEASEADDVLTAAVRAAAEAAFAIEPAAGAVTKAQVEEVRPRLARIGELAAGAERSEEVDAAIAMVHGRCAAIAVAAGELDTARGWLEEAAKYARDDDQRAELATAREQPERFRALVHGRNLFAHGKERRARKLWKQVARGVDGAKDPIAKSAAAELKAPRPLNGELPSLWSYNGFGVQFAGHRDEWSDGTYATTQCITALFIPLFPIASYRVTTDGEGWIVLAREPLSAFARVMRYVLVGGIAAVIAVIAINSYVSDPERLARKRFDRAIAAAPSRAPEAGIRAFDELLAGPDLALAGRERAHRAGAEIIRLTAGMAPKPFKREHADHANRLVQRYKLMPPEVQGGAARDAVVDAIEGWVKELGGGTETAEARLALLKLGADVADAKRSGPLLTQIAATRLAVADAKAAEQPLDALEVLMEQPSTDAMARAKPIMARLVESPSTLVAAGGALDRWLGAMPAGDPLRQGVTTRREEALAGRTEAEAEGTTPAQLEAMAVKRPWDQYVQLRLAGAEIDAGKLEAAASRLDKLGPHGLLVREARLLLAQLSSRLGKLDQADALLTGLLAGRLERFVAASGAVQQARTRAVERVQRDLQTGNVPPDLEHKLQAESGDEARNALVREWGNQQIAEDPAVKQAEEALLAVADVVQISIVAGMVKLRRAQGLAGAARDATLLEAERTFLAIRTEAEGRPEFQLGLGEIYARLGKSKESEAEFAAVLAKHEPHLSLRLASIYRDLGSVERAREVATSVYNKQGEPRSTQHAAGFLGLLETGIDDDAAEGWYRKANTSEPHVRAALLELEGRRLLRQGKRAECGPKFAEVARMHLESAHPSYNNAAVAHVLRYHCTSDVTALADAEQALEKAYRADQENPIIVGNLVWRLDSNSKMRVVGKRLDSRAAPIDDGDAELVLGVMVEGLERDAILAELAADRSAQRAAELLLQYEVLAPSNTASYREGFAAAKLRRDEVAARAVLERARRAKQLDTSEAVAAREKYLSGESDDKQLESLTSELGRLTETLARRPAGKSRAVALARDASMRHAIALLKADRAMLTRAREEALEAMKLWPALDLTSSITSSLIDEAGLEADAAAWVKLRRQRSAVSTLAKLAAEGSPLAASIRGSKQWGELAGHVKNDRSRPGLDDLRLARLLGDAGLEARAKAVLDDKFARMSRELAALLSPGDPTTAEDLAYLDRR